MKIITLITVLALASTSLFANEGMELEDAPQTVIATAIEQCEAYASEDNIEAEDLKDYMLLCVNEELDAEGYKKITSLP